LSSGIYCLKLIIVEVSSKSSQNYLSLYFPFAANAPIFPSFFSFFAIVSLLQHVL
jgi:hypothetical protein